MNFFKISLTCLTFLIATSLPVHASMEKAKAAYVKNDMPTVFKEAMEDAKLDNIIAQTLVAKLYEEGTGTKQNYVEARKWYTRAAEQGSIDAQNMLGNMYYEGRDLKDLEKAFKYYSMAAKQENPAGQLNVARMYARGEFVKQNYTEAFKYRMLAAKQNSPGAQFEVGLCYMLGEGVTKDYTKAREWYTLAANQKSNAAQAVLAQAALDALNSNNK